MYITADGHLLHVLGEEVDLLTVLVGDDVPGRGSCVSAQNHSVFELYTDDCCSSLRGLWGLEAIGEKQLIPANLRS